MKLGDLVDSPERVRQLPPPEADPLRSNGILDEALLVSAVVDHAADRLVLILDMRLADQIRGDNAAILVLNGIRALSWRLDPQQPYKVPLVLGWEVTPPPPGFSLGLIGGWSMDATGTEAWFCTGTIPGLSPAQPDFMAMPRETVLAELASLSSEFVPRAFANRT